MNSFKYRVMVADVCVDLSFVQSTYVYVFLVSPISVLM